MTEKAQVAKMPVEVVDRQTSVEVFHLLSETLPVEALSIDNSRGFPLTSIKAAFVLERLTEVFGLLGYGWRYAVGPHWREVGDKEEVLVEVALQWRIDDSDRLAYSAPVYWVKKIDPDSGMAVEGWAFATGPAVWSEPIFAKGGSSARRKGSTPLTDAHRSAVTNAITKVAARLGVGVEVYKDQDELSQGNGEKPKTGRRQGNSPRNTTRKSGAKRPSSAPRPTRAHKAGNGYADLEAIQAAAQVHVGKLNVDAAQEPQAKVLEQLATKMEGVGLKMQPMRLIHALLGVGAFTQKGVIGTYNFLVEGHLTTENIELLNQVAFS